ncbi:MAG: hypothetical protein LBG61_00775 [Burkholderiales bacterium]|jgi:SH3-like domain-containing protein|nr:hypothetical protein [Burkholderiales bacterium]
MFNHWKQQKQVLAIAVALSTMFFVGVLNAAEFRSVDKPPAVLYDAPSQKARGLFIYGAGTPLEVLSSIEGWHKVRDKEGSIGWVERAVLADRRILQVRVAKADAREQATDAAPIAFEAEQDDLLFLDEPARSPAEAEFPGWVRVQNVQTNRTGYIRIDRVFGL